jgi:hypothetical protein
MEGLLDLMAYCEVGFNWRCTKNKIGQLHSYKDLL